MFTNTPPVADFHVCVIDPDGTCVLNPRVPEMEGSKPWEWCHDDDQEECREVFIDACMFRERRTNRQFRLVLDGERPQPVEFHLHPLRTGQVLCLARRLFNAELTDREKEVLLLLSGDASAEQIADSLGISPSTARDHISRIKRKLDVRSQEALRIAAQQVSLA